MKPDVRAGYLIGLTAASKIASQFSVKKDRTLHPDIPWEELKPEVRVAAHTTAQQIALEILEELEKALESA